MDTVAVEDFLTHHGVKGMKWGVRQDRGHEGERVKTKKLAKLDNKWQKQFEGVHGYIAIHNAVADKMNNGGLDRVNNKPEYKGVNMWNPKNKHIAEKYFDDIATEQVKALHQVANEFGTNPSGTKKLKLTIDKETSEVFLKFADVEHADTDFSGLEWVGKLDVKGQVSEIHEAEQDAYLEQMDAAAEFLSHYGVKGMRWGRRNSGLVKEAPSEEAVKLQNIHTRAKTHKSTSPLSNKELQDAIKRMQLEQQYSQLSGGMDKTRRQKAANFVHELIMGAGKQGSQQLANEEAKKQFKSAFETAKSKAKS